MFTDIENLGQTDIQNGAGIALGGDDFAAQNASRSWSLSALDADTLRFELRSGDHWPGDGTEVERSEISDQQDVTNSDSVHVSYQFMVENGAQNTAAWLVIGQFHQDSSSAPGRSPPFEIDLSGEHMVVEVRYQDASGEVVTKDLFTDPADIQRDHLYDMNISATFDPAGNGHLTVTRDGDQIAKYDGPFGYLDQSSVYWKQGIYRADASETMAVQYKNLSITHGPDTLVFHVSEDAYQGDAQFFVDVDGQQVGGVQTVHASHEAGAWDDISLAGNFANAHDVSVEFVNDRSDGTYGTDRNLYVGSVSLNGQSLTGSDAQLNFSYGQQHLGDTVELAQNGSVTFDMTGLNWHI